LFSPVSTSLGSGDYSSYYSVSSLTRIFSTFVFLEEKHQQESLTFKPYESLKQRRQEFVSNISKTPQLSTVAFLKLSQAFKQAFGYSAFTHKQRSKEKAKSPA